MFCALEADPVVLVADVAQQVLELPLFIAPTADDDVDSCFNVGGT